MEKRTVLLVDDDPDFVAAVKSVVEKGGYNVNVAYDGEEALESVAKAKPDLIILDVMMPGLHGHKTCDRLKGNPETANIPIILLTAVAERIRSSSYTHYDMISSKADDYIPKPVEPDELLRRIKEWIS